LSVAGAGRRASRRRDAGRSRLSGAYRRGDDSRLGLLHEIHRLLYLTGGDHASLVDNENGPVYGPHRSL